MPPIGSCSWPRFTPKDSTCSAKTNSVAGWSRTYRPWGNRPVDFITTTVGIRVLRDIIGRIEYGVFG